MLWISVWDAQSEGIYEALLGIPAFDHLKTEIFCVRIEWQIEKWRKSSGWIIYLMAKLEWFFPEVSTTAVLNLVEGRRRASLEAPVCISGHVRWWKAPDSCLCPLYFSVSSSLHTYIHEIFSLQELCEDNTWLSGDSSLSLRSKWLIHSSKVITQAEAQADMDGTGKPVWEPGARLLCVQQEPWEQWGAQQTPTHQNSYTSHSHTDTSTWKVHTQVDFSWTPELCLM